MYANLLIEDSEFLRNSAEGLSKNVFVSSSTVKISGSRFIDAT